MPLLEIQELSMSFVAGRSAAAALDRVSLSIEEGETMCLVGESGSGKTVTATSIARLVPTPPARYDHGKILLQGRDVFALSRKELQKIRGGVVSYVFQDPAASLNPVIRVGEQILESLRLHRPDLATEKEALRLLSMVGISAPETRLRSYPHQMSGGMLQRVMIAMAIATRPKLLVADEPTTALDVTIQAQVLELLRDLKQKLGMAILLITHNLGVVRDLADRVAVMYAGQIVEQAPAGRLLSNPLHPYTRALLRSVPQLGASQERLISIPGAAPQPGSWPSGCRFHPRCPQRQLDCHETVPPLIPAQSEHTVRCPYWPLGVEPDARARFEENHAAARS